MNHTIASPKKIREEAISVRNEVMYSHNEHASRRSESRKKKRKDFSETIPDGFSSVSKFSTFNRRARKKRSKQRKWLQEAQQLPDDEGASTI